MHGIVSSRVPNPVVDGPGILKPSIQGLECLEEGVGEAGLPRCGGSRPIVIQGVGDMIGRGKQEWI